MKLSKRLKLMRRDFLCMPFMGNQKPKNYFYKVPNKTLSEDMRNKVGFSG